MYTKKTVIFLMGPTACGKTSLAIGLAKIMSVEIINVDSAQIYIGMDIGTNKPSKEQLAIVKHNLIDICLPQNNYSVAEFCKDANRLIKEIHAKGKVPLLVGGTMLYFYALCFGLSELPSKNIEIRNDILQSASEFGWPEMHARLTKLDPIIANTININDSQRIQRALEINILTGKKISDCFSKMNSFIENWNIYYLAILQQDRAVLHKKIADRFYSMVQQGFVEEVEWLLQQDIPLSMPAMRCVGYRQISEYLQNTISREDAYQKAIVATRQLAKRQYTWLRKWAGLVDLKQLYVESSEKHNLDLITRFLN